MAEGVIAILVVEDRAALAEPPAQRCGHRQAEPAQQRPAKSQLAPRPADLGSERDALQIAPDPSAGRDGKRPQDVQPGLDRPELHPVAQLAPDSPQLPSLPKRRRAHRDALDEQHVIALGVATHEVMTGVGVAVPPVSGEAQQRGPRHKRRAAT